MFGGSGIQTVMGSDGRIHMEQRIGNMRVDMMTGKRTWELNHAGGMQTVMHDDGRIGLEQRIGNMRIDTMHGTRDWLL